MLKQGLVCSLLLLLLAQAKYYAIDSDFHMKEIPESIADFAMHDPKMIGFIEYRDDRENSGWIYYYYKASSANADWLQLYLSGYMEGYAGYNFIWDNYVNSEMYFTINEDIMGFVHNQTNWIHQQIAENPQDEYWNLVNATFAQIYGMYDGYQAGIKAFHHTTDMNLTFDQFYMVTYLMDLFDVISKYTGNTVSRPPKCSFLAKMTEESLYVSHTTWFDYTGLLRIYKVLDFDLQNPLVLTKRISFSAQPGYATSQDDFYILDNGRMVAETSLQSNNNDVYSWIHYDSIPYWIRITVANLAYGNQQNWANIYFAHRSGTYNNQWLVIDFYNFNVSKGNPSEAQDIIWIIEEFYSLTSAQDVTQQLLIPQGYVGSYNVPYVPEIQKLSQNPTNYTTDPRYFLFKKYAPGVQTMEDFKYVMRLDNFTDTQDYCQAIAPRCDLSNSTDFPWGAIDCKTTDEVMAPNHQAWIQSGPTHENLPPFTWAKWPQYNKSRSGMPEVYDFDWVFMDPNTNYSANARAYEHGFLAYEGYYAFIMEANLERESLSI